MKQLFIVLVLSFAITVHAQKAVIVGTASDTTYLELKAQDNKKVMQWDNGRARLYNHFNLLGTDRDWIRIYLDADDNQSNAEFSIYKDTFGVNGYDVLPELKFNLDGGYSWINSGNVGVGLTSPTSTLHVNAPTNADPFRVQVNGSTKFRIFEDGAVSIGLNNENISPGDVYIHNRLGIGMSNPSAPLTVVGPMQSRTQNYGTYIEMVNEQENNAINTTGIGNLYFRMNAQDRMWLNNNGDLWLSGALRAGNLLGSGSDGMIRYNGIDLQGKVNGVWRSLTQSGSNWNNTGPELRPNDPTKRISLNYSGSNINYATLAIGNWSDANNEVYIETSRKHALSIESDHAVTATSQASAAKIVATGAGTKGMEITTGGINSASLQVFNAYPGTDGSQNAINVIQSGKGSAINVSQQSSASTAIGISVSSNFSSNGIGVQAFGAQAIRGISTKSVPDGGVGVYGLNNYAGTSEARGGTFEAEAGSAGIGVYGRGSHTAMKGYGLVNDFHATGPGVDYASGSSRRWKDNIQNITNPIDKIKQLRGVTFTWDQAHGGRSDVGFIAEEMAEVIPEIVVYNSDGIHVDGLDYSKTTPLIVEALNTLIKDYELQIKSLQAQLSAQQEAIDELKAIVNKNN